jgi:hypothetical protein
LSGIGERAVARWVPWALVRMPMVRGAGQRRGERRVYPCGAHLDERHACLGDGECAPVGVIGGQTSRIGRMPKSARDARLKRRGGPTTVSRPSLVAGAHEEGRLTYVSPSRHALLSHGRRVPHGRAGALEPETRTPPMLSGWALKWIRRRPEVGRIRLSGRRYRPMCKRRATGRRPEAP